MSKMPLTRHPLSPRELNRLQEMNKLLYPARLKITPTGAFQFHYYRKGQMIRQVIGQELELSYERALLMRKELDSLPVVSNRKIKLQEWYDQWSGKHFTKLAVNTVEGYHHFWNAVSSRLKQTELPKITSDLIESELDLIPKESMREHAAVLLSVMLKAAVRAGLLTSSPFSVGYKKHKKLVNVLSTDQLIRLFREASDSARPAMALAAFCGLRRGEIMALTVGDVDLEQRRIYVRHAKIKTFGTEGVEAIKCTKTGEQRVAPIPQAAIPYLTCVEGRDRDELLYPSFRSDLISRVHFACKKAGLPKLTFHDLRHICASNLVMTSGMATAQAVLGHTNIKTTVNAYSHLNSIYLVNQANRASLSENTLNEIRDRAEKFTDYPDKEVAVLMKDVLQILQFFAIGNKKGYGY